MLTLFKIRHIYGPTSLCIREVQFAAKTKRGARIAYGKRYHVGVFDFVYITETE